MIEQDLSKLSINKSKPAPEAKMRLSRRSRKLWLSLLILMILAGLLFGRTLNRAIEVETTTVTTAYPSQGFTVLNATGYVVAERKAEVASKGTGRLEWLGVREGSRVKKGEVIARLESRDVAATREQSAANLAVARANVQQAEAELADAKLALARAKNLSEQGFVSQAAHDDAVARHNKAQAAVQSAKAAVGASNATLRGSEVAVEYTLIRAPFDGVVLSKNANVGDVITPLTAGTEVKGAVATMADMDTLEVEADVSESSLQKVSVGQPCEIQLDALPDHRFRCVVQRIVPTVDRAKATVLAKVRFIDKDPRILPEMSAKVAFLSKPVTPEQQKPLTVIPVAAVAQRDSKNVAFLVQEGKTPDKQTAKQVDVVLGTKIGDLVEINNGLKLADKIVLNPPSDLKDGAAIKSKAK